MLVVEAAAPVGGGGLLCSQADHDAGDPGKGKAMATEREGIPEQATTIASAKTPPVKERRKGRKASDLVPDLSKHGPAVLRTCWYWIGALPSCPTEHLDLKGIHFPKVEEQLIGNGIDGIRRPVIGTLVCLTSEQVEQVSERLSRTVIRFQKVSDVLGVSNETGEGKPVSEAFRPKASRRIGYPVTIPTKEALAGRARPYDPRPTDEPAARYLFAQPCADQRNPTRGENYPPPLEKTGIEWPGDE